MTSYSTIKSMISERYLEIKSGCGANKPGGGGFAAGNTCARGGGKSYSEKELSDAVISYSHDMEAGRRIAAASENVLTGNKIHTSSAEDQKKAEIIINEIRNAPIRDKVLHRGAGYDSESNRLHNLKEGDEFNMQRLVSFSADKEIAVDYAHGRAGATAYLLKIEGEHKSFSTDKLSGLEHKEFIIQGAFKVVKVLPSSKVVISGESRSKQYQITKTIVIQQTGVF